MLLVAILQSLFFLFFFVFLLFFFKYVYSQLSENISMWISFKEYTGNFVCIYPYINVSYASCECTGNIEVAMCIHPDMYILEMSWQ